MPGSLRSDTAACVNDNHLYVNATVEKLSEAGQALASAGRSITITMPTNLATQSSPGKSTPTKASPTTRAARKFVDKPDADAFSAVESSDLRGMGGAGFRRSKMERRPQGQGDEKYIVCNADESEPGTFKDRELLLRTPYWSSKA